MEKLSLLQQLNGDVVLSDADDDDAPLLKLVFTNEFAKWFSDEQKVELFRTMLEPLGGMLRKKSCPEEAQIHRKEAVLATRQKRENAI
jgi:hypothetical protein